MACPAHINRWILHGEPPDGSINENVDHMDEHIGFNENANENISMNEEEEQDDDRLPDMLEELYVAEQDEGKSLFASVLEEIKKELYPSAASTRFSFVVRLLHIKSFYRISNVSFQCNYEAVIIGISQLLSSRIFP